MPKDILLFGGTFDPVHNAHLAIARAVADLRGFARVTLIPTNNPPHKPPPRAPAADRLAMLKIAVKGDELFEICELELGRQGPSYTIDTLQALRGELGEANLHWLIGADMLADLPSWHRVDKVLALASIVIAARPMERGTVQDALAGSPRASRLGDLAGRLSDAHIAQLREGLVDTPLIDISSSDIRRRVAAGDSIDGLVPPPVAQYIADHGLYTTPEPPRRDSPRGHPAR